MIFKTGMMVVGSVRGGGLMDSWLVRCEGKVM